MALILQKDVKGSMYGAGWLSMVYAVWELKCPGFEGLWSKGRVWLNGRYTLLLSCPRRAKMNVEFDVREDDETIRCA
ncbi:hypothetical protein [Thiobacillus sp.]